MSHDSRTDYALRGVGLLGLGLLAYAVLKTPQRQKVPVDLAQAAANVRGTPGLARLDTRGPIRLPPVTRRTLPKGA